MKINNYGSILSDLSCSDDVQEDDDDDERSASSLTFSSDSSSVGPCYESSSNGTSGISLSIGIGFCWAFLVLLLSFIDTTTDDSSVVRPTTVVELVSATNHPIDQAKYFTQQLIDHDHPDTSGTFRQRYYENLNYWKGPGYPIFLILGGEGPLERILYPFVSEVLAERFGAVTFNPEHRYVPFRFQIYVGVKKTVLMFTLSLISADTLASPFRFKISRPRTFDNNLHPDRPYKIIYISFNLNERSWAVDLVAQQPTVPS
jgi:hypothetical protein